MNYLNHCVYFLRDALTINTEILNYSMTVENEMSKYLHIFTSHMKISESYVENVKTE